MNIFVVETIKNFKMETLQYKSVKSVMTTPYKECRVTCLTFSPFSQEEVFIANARGTVVYKMKNPSTFKEKLFYWLYKAPAEDRRTNKC